jgi:hypothetical protein
MLVVLLAPKEADQIKQPLPASYLVDAFAPGVGLRPTVSLFKGVRQTGVEPVTVRLCA